MLEHDRTATRGIIQRRRLAAGEDLNVGDPGEERLDLVGQRRRFAAGEDLNPTVCLRS
ncbi:hypothetical protein [Melissospora conviva]|uniref:hypothetical protein n=1 Tax=Melissospora conviva TaxID=3388432 RepID=UPI003C1B2615